LADSIVNGIVNFGSQKESLFSTDPSWISKVKDSGIMTAVSTLGFIYYQSFDEFSAILSDYLELKDGYAKAGACIAIGMTSTRVRDENEPCLALLMDYLNSED
jgi:26S proteasome regulatory subunit N1